MKSKEIQQLRGKTPEAMRDDINAYREKLRSLKFDLFNGKVKNVREIREIRKTIARLFTFINEKKTS